MTNFICPKFGTVCESEAQCSRINEPLADALPDIRRETGGIRLSLASTVLKNKLESTANSLLVDLHPTTSGFVASVCPIEVLEGELDKKLGVVVATEAMYAMMQTCVDHTIEDLRSRT